MYSREQPSICTGCRGIASIRIKVIGPSHDVHSGGYGGVINNPLQALAEIIASFKDRNGKVKVQGFYDDVVLPTEEERAEYKRFPFNEQVVAEKLGVPQLFGEKDFTPVERMWIRPTLDANGMWGGFQGEGSSTIIPADAQCSITCRLVPNQDPETICKLLDSHIHKHVPPGVRVETRYHAGYARPYMVDKNHPAVTALAQALHELYGVEPIYTRAGGSLPFVATMSEALSAPVLLTGMGSPGSNVHGPNEFFAIQDFDRLVKMLPMVWSKLAVMLRK